MLHLPIERLAELVDGGATPGEREHLLLCAACSRELESYRRLVAMAADERRRIAPPLTAWETLGARLRAEGLAAGDPTPRAPRSSALLEFTRRAAAVVVLVGSGMVLGRMSAGLTVIDAVALRPAATGSIDSALPAGPAATGEEGSARGRFAADGDEPFASSTDALAALDAAQRQYERAASWLASNDTSTSDLAPEQYRTRLAALDRTAETMQQAMRDAPTDPYLNQYYLATLSARQQTLRRLGTALPVGNKLGRF
jgi:hypothetical protein